MPKSPTSTQDCHLIKCQDTRPLFRINQMVFRFETGLKFYHFLREIPTGIEIDYQIHLLPKCHRAHSTSVIRCIISVPARQSVYRCIGVSVYRCIGASAPVGVSVYRCERGNRCIGVSVRARQSVYRCIGASASIVVLVYRPARSNLCIRASVYILLRARQLVSWRSVPSRQPVYRCERGNRCSGVSAAVGVSVHRRHAMYRCIGAKNV